MKVFAEKSRKIIIILIFPTRIFPWGLVVLMDRFQVHQLRRTQERFLEEPYLRHHLRGRIVFVFAHWIVGRLLSISLRPSMDQKNALELMHGPIENELMRLACRELPPGINCEERQSHSSKAREASFNRKGKCKHGGVAPWLRCRPCQAAGIVGSGSLLS